MTDISRNATGSPETGATAKNESQAIHAITYEGRATFPAWCDECNAERPCAEIVWMKGPKQGQKAVVCAVCGTERAAG